MVFLRAFVALIDVSIFWGVSEEEEKMDLFVVCNEVRILVNVNLFTMDWFNIISNISVCFT